MTQVLPRFEAAAHHGRERPFGDLEAALKHIDGSGRDLTRPWVRVLFPDGTDVFLIVAGRKLDVARAAAALDEHDRARLHAWNYIGPQLRIVLDMVDGAGAVRIEHLGPAQREILGDAVARGILVLDGNEVRRPVPGPIADDEARDRSQVDRS